MIIIGIKCVCVCAEMTKQYYRGAKACVLAFSTTDRASYEAIEKWNEKVLRECDDNICRVLIQNKIDLLSERVVEEQEAEDLATRLNVKFYRASVKNNFNVDAVFQYLAVQYMKQKQQQQQQQTQMSGRSNRGAMNNNNNSNNNNNNSTGVNSASNSRNNGDNFTDRPFNLEKANMKAEETRRRSSSNSKANKCC